MRGGNRRKGFIVHRPRSCLLYFGTCASDRCAAMQACRDWHSTPRLHGSSPASSPRGCAVGAPRTAVSRATELSNGPWSPRRPIANPAPPRSPRARRISSTPSRGIAAANGRPPSHAVIVQRLPRRPAPWYGPNADPVAPVSAGGEPSLNRPVIRSAPHPCARRREICRDPSRRNPSPVDRMGDARRPVHLRLPYIAERRQLDARRADAG
jgi:hypothetical protein